MIKKVKCHVCGNKFAPEKDNTYIVANSLRGGLAAAFSGEELKLFDAIDCPFCDCQNILGVRLDKHSDETVV